MRLISEPFWGDYQLRYLNGAIPFPTANVGVGTVSQEKLDHFGEASLGGTLQGRLIISRAKIYIGA